jgi:hypothetical protein
MTPGTEPNTLPDPVRAMLDGAAPRAYVCAGTRRAPPVSHPQDLLATLAGA